MPRRFHCWVELEGKRWPRLGGDRRNGSLSQQAAPGPALAGIRAAGVNSALIEALSGIVTSLPQLPPRKKTASPSLPLIAARKPR